MGQPRSLEELQRSFEEPAARDVLLERLPLARPEANPQHAEQLRRRLFPDG